MRTRCGWRGWILAGVLLPLSAWASPFASLPLIPPGETAATGKTLFILEDGDFVEPLFSPDSRYLAFAREASETAGEPTEIRVLDLKSLQVRPLRAASALRGLSVSRSFVSGFAWKSADTLKASISDGDVNGVDLVFDVASGKLIENKPMSFADETPGRDAALVTESVKAFPSIPLPVMENALAGGFRVGEKKFIIQKNYWKQDNHVWLLDAGRKQMTKMIDLPETWIYSLRGAFASGNAVILYLAYGQEAWLVRHAGGRLERLYHLPVKNYQQTRLRVEHVRGDRVLFQVSTGADYEKRNNYFFLYDRDKLKKITDTGEIYDLDVDPAGKRVCFSQWQGKRRRLVVKELQDLY